jgi:alpha-beta hydrolase superfamily lysophospholipase
LPQSVRENTFESAGGLKIFFRSWRPEAKPRAVIVICHGVNSHGGQYLWPAEQFVKLGFAVYALDLRGRGKSEGERFYVGRRQALFSQKALNRGLVARVEVPVARRTQVHPRGHVLLPELHGLADQQVIHT